MIEILPESTEKLIAISVSGELNSDDYDRMRPEFDLRAKGNGTFDVLVELTDIDKLQPSVIKDELEFTKDYSGDIENMAVVAEKTGWTRVADLVGKPFGEILGVELKQFEDRSVALSWLDSQRS